MSILPWTGNLSCGKGERLKKTLCDSYYWIIQYLSLRRASVIHSYLSLFCTLCGEHLFTSCIKSTEMQTQLKSMHQLCGL